MRGKIGSLGEFGLIERIKGHIPADSTVKKGIGDDCAVIRSGQNKFLLYTCDMIVEGVDFTSHDHRMLVGRKALAVSLSDIAACGGVPRYCLVSLGLPGNSDIEEVDRIYKGMTSLARQFKVSIIGGDISRAPKLTINVTLTGEVEKKNLVLRSGAKKGDIIFVTGSFGGSLKGKHLNFVPRVKEARYLVRNYRINSMIDASDGLRPDLGHILEESRVGAVIYEDLIPVSPEAKGLRNALCDGEDFELIFTVGLGDARRLRACGKQFIPIGEIVSRDYGLTLVDRQVRQREIRQCGFTHF